MGLEGGHWSLEPSNKRKAALRLSLSAPSLGFYAVLGLCSSSLDPCSSQFLWSPAANHLNRQTFERSHVANHRQRTEIKEDREDEVQE